MFLSSFVTFLYNAARPFMSVWLIMHTRWNSLPHSRPWNIWSHSGRGVAVFALPVASH